MINKSALWCEKHRPTSIDKYIFHDETHRKTITRMIEEGIIPHLLLSGIQGSGKAQPLSAKIYQPDGYTTMGDIQVGDTIITPTGIEASVIGTFPQGRLDIYTITFHDGSTTECCLDHLWECYYVNDPSISKKASKHVINTKRIIELLKHNDVSKNKYDISIPLISGYDQPSKHVPIDPYLLGVLLGDGSLIGPSPRITSADPQIIAECEAVLIAGYQLKLIKNTEIEYVLSCKNPTNHGGTTGKPKNAYSVQLSQLGLSGKKSMDKFIPTTYQRMSLDQNWELIRGLMDTDGTCDKKGHVSYCTSSERLATQLQQILWSVGCTCTITSDMPKHTYNDTDNTGVQHYTLHIAHNNGTKQFFKLNRKRDRGTSTFAENHNRGDITLRRRIRSIEYTSTEEAKCIQIDDPNHLYITDDYIVTHNTTLAKLLCSELNVDDMDVMILNASDENSVDVMRDKLKSFISTFAVGAFKIVILDEADYISQAGQAILRHMLENNSDNVRFILTCNYENKIIHPLKSRLQQLRFKAPDIDDITMMVATILMSENIAFDLEDLDVYVSVGYPDVRKIINLVQQNTLDDTLMSSTSGTAESSDYKFTLLEMMETGNWVRARNTICDNVMGEEWYDLYKFLYENLHKAKQFKKDGGNWEQGILAIAEHAYKHELVAAPEINATALFIRLSMI